MMIILRMQQTQALCNFLCMYYFIKFQEENYDIFNNYKYQGIFSNIIREQRIPKLNK